MQVRTNYEASAVYSKLEPAGKRSPPCLAAMFTTAKRGLASENYVDRRFSYKPSLFGT